jgi:predicted Mrr-cat superfamily restriction endonuclease
LYLALKKGDLDDPRQVGVGISYKRHDYITRIRGGDDIINEIMKNYEKFGDDLKAELPLKKIWTLVEEEPE